MARASRGELIDTQWDVNTTGELKSAIEAMN